MGQNNDGELCQLLDVDYLLSEYGIQIVLDKDNRGYLLHSGITQDRFVTIWPIIENFDLFSRVTNLLSEAITSIAVRHNIDIVLGCTTTVMHLLDALKPRLQHVTDVFYIGTHPLLLHSDTATLRLRNKNVLILTDVISSGTLCSDICQEVSYCGASPAAIASLYHAYDATHSGLVSDALGRRSLNVDTYPAKTNVPIYSYSTVSVHTGKQSGSGEYSVVDVESVFPPVASIELDTSHQPLIPIHEDKRLFAEQCVMSLGYFNKRLDTFSIYSHISGLLEKKISAIESVLGHWYSTNKPQVAKSNTFNKLPLLVTTTTNDNRYLISLLSRHLKENGFQVQFAAFSRFDDLEAAFPFLLSESQDSIEGRPVLVLLSTIHSSVTARSLAALLSLHGATSIDIFAILNRMTPGSSSFLSRIAHLNENRPNNRTESNKDGDPKNTKYRSFSFRSLYRIWDLASADLHRVERIVLSRFKQFTVNLPPTLRLMAENDLKHFRPTDIHECTPPTPGEKHNNDIEAIESVEIYLCLEDFLRTRHIDPLLKALEQAGHSKSNFFALCRYILSDFGRLTTVERRTQLTHSFVTLFNKSSTRISSAATPQERKSAVAYEKLVLTGCALFSPLFLTLPDCSTNNSEAKDCPRTILDCLERIRESMSTSPRCESLLARIENIDWCFSFIFALNSIHGTVRRDSSAQVNNYTSSDEWTPFLSTLEALRDTLDSITKSHYDQAEWPEWFMNWAEGHSAAIGEESNEYSSLYLPSSMLHSLLSVWEAFRQPEEENILNSVLDIRRVLLWPIPHHNYVGDSLTKKVELLHSSFILHVFMGKPRRQLPLDAANMRYLSDILTSVRKYQEIHAAIGRIVRDSIGYATRFKYFVNSGPSTLSDDLLCLERILLTSRSESTIWRSDLDMVRDLCMRICTHTWGTVSLNESHLLPGNSSLAQLIMAYEADLIDVVSAIKARYYSVPHECVISLRIHDLTTRKATVICEPTLLERVIDNLVHNTVKHDESGACHILIRSTSPTSENITKTTNDNEYQDDLANEFIDVAVISAFAKVKWEESTLRDQRQRVERLGGLLFDEVADGKLHVILRLPRVSPLRRQLS